MVPESIRLIPKMIIALRHEEGIQNERAPSHDPHPGRRFDKAKAKMIYKHRQHCDHAQQESSHGRSPEKFRIMFGLIIPFEVGYVKGKMYKLAALRI